MYFRKKADKNKISKWTIFLCRNPLKEIGKEKANSAELKILESIYLKGRISYIARAINFLFPNDYFVLLVPLILHSI